MSTKVREACPVCGKMVEPIDRAMAVESHYSPIDIPVKFWRHQCWCGYIWANDAQREHNAGAPYNQFKAECRRRRYE